VIHYKGALSIRPGRVACQAVSPQAVTRRWQAADCPHCRETLIDLPVRWTGPGRVTGVVREVEPRPGGGATVSVWWNDRGATGTDICGLGEFETSWEPGA
jgi:hypothetical protein